ncbi:MAG: RNA-binding protein [Rhodoferax sp.]|nr:RNA-binding protein [Rhodoferax sp.]
MTEPVRLSKRVAEMVPCSRREAEQYIEGGWVRVDGQVVETPQFRVAGQTIVLDPKAQLAPILPVTVLLHKPAGYDWDLQGPKPASQLLVPQNHWGPDRSGIRLLKRHLVEQRCVTPLEHAATGLLVFSQERPILRKLLEDGALVEHEVIVDVREAVSEEALVRLRRSPVVDGRAMLPAKVSVTSDSGGVTSLRFATKGCHPGQLAQMCGQAGLTIVGMRRIRVGRVPLSTLPVGQWRYLLPTERF